MRTIGNLLPKLMIVISVGSIMMFTTACQKASFKASGSGLNQTAIGPDVDGNGIITPADIDGGSTDTDAGCYHGTVCNNTPIPPATKDPTVDLPVATEIEDLPRNPNYPQTAQCGYNIFENTTRTVNYKAIDLWLIVDSSNSFDTERVALGNAIIDGFTQASQIGNKPVNVKVVAAQTEGSPYSAYNGSPFYQHTNEPLSVTLTRDMSAAEVNAAKDALLSKLDENMKRDPLSQQNAAQGGHSGANELGLANLYWTMGRDQVAADNALAVMFISDENDICMGDKYNDPGQEMDIYNASCINRNAKFNDSAILPYITSVLDTISPLSVYETIRNYTGKRPTVMNSLVYSGFRPVPQDAFNSIGWGYLDVTSMAGGRVIELAPPANGDPDEYLTRAARDSVTRTANMINRFSTFYPHYQLKDKRGNVIQLWQLMTKTNADGKEVRDLQVYVGGLRVGYTLDFLYNLVTPARSGSPVRIDYCWDPAMKRPVPST